MPMDRRTSIAALLGRGGQLQQAKVAAVAAPTLVTTGLEPYAGPWTREQAAHLLRRATFGPNKARIDASTALGLNAAVGQLFEALPAPAPPVYYDYSDDPNVPLGETWVEAPAPQSVVGLNGARARSLRAWTMTLIYNEGSSILEKLTLFWHNHFAINNINDARFNYRYITTLRQYAWGNFRDLVKAVTIDPAMLRFLNGNQNTNVAPNENYARELLELFTIGKGPQAGPGDYTHYTEQDVIEMARVLTGWRDRGFNNGNPVPIEAYYTANRHDTGVKTLSARFDGVTIPNMGANEYSHLVDVIFGKDEVARFICRKLYRWFVYYIIDENAEQNVIEPMAQLLISNNYEIRPALEALLKSAHFYDMLSVGPMIRHPFDYVITTLKTTGAPLPVDFAQRSNVLFRVFQLITALEMAYYNLPDVAGWKAYYQEPLFYRSWITANTLQLRSNFVKAMAGGGTVYGGFRLRIDPLAWIATFDDAFDPNAMIEEMVRLLCPVPLVANQYVALKEALLPGLPDYEWGLEYGDYLDNPNNVALRDAVTAKLRNLLTAILTLPEFHLS